MSKESARKLRISISITKMEMACRGCQCPRMLPPSPIYKRLETLLLLQAAGVVFQPLVQVPYPLVGDPLGTYQDRATSVSGQIVSRSV